MFHIFTLDYWQLNTIYMYSITYKYIINKDKIYYFFLKMIFKTNISKDLKT